MKHIFKDLKDVYPKVHSLLNFGPSENIEELIYLNLPSDYYELYNLVSHENADSDGVFGLYQLLPANLSNAVTDPEFLDIGSGEIAEIFMPIFQFQRIQIGYAKFKDSWEFCELDVSIERIGESLTKFLGDFHQMLINNGYTDKDEGGECVLGLIDRSELD